MIDLNDMALFVRVAESGSMSAAGRLLNLPKSNVSRRIAQLEASVGAPLLRRSTRAMALTDAGRSFYERIRPLTLEAEQAVLEIRSRNARPSGLVRISATSGFGQHVIGPILCGIMAAEPELRFDLQLSDARASLIADTIDIAIRMGELEDSGLVSRKLANVRRCVVASPGYIAGNGRPERPEDLRGHACIVTSPELAVWRFESGAEVRAPWRFSAGNIFMARDAALAGHGVALLPHFLAAEAIAAGALLELLTGDPPPPAAAHALYPRDRIPSLAARTVLDRLIAALQDFDG